MTTAQHLAWLLHLMEPPYTNGWRQHCWARALELAPEHPDLPALLTAAMQSKEVRDES